MNISFKSIQQVVVPDELAARRRESPRIGTHLTLKRESQVVRITEVEVTGKIQILEHLQIPVELTIEVTRTVSKHTTDQCAIVCITAYLPTTKSLIQSSIGLHQQYYTKPLYTKIYEVTVTTLQWVYK